MNQSRPLRYLDHYQPELLVKVHRLIDDEILAKMLINKYPSAHTIRSNRALYEYVMGLKNDYLRKSAPIARIAWDDRIGTLDNALGQHRFVSRVQGKKHRSSNEIRIASVFKNGPLPFLRMIAVHELAHLREKEHNRAFYNLCVHMEPDYHQYEFDMRLYLTCLDLFGPVYR